MSSAPSLSASPLASVGSGFASAAKAGTSLEEDPSLGPKHKLVAMDFDGTLYSHTAGCICSTAIEELHRIGEEGVLRVIATGRNFAALKKALPMDTPVDYVITGSGSMTMRWPSESILTSHYLPASFVRELATLLITGSGSGAESTTGSKGSEAGTIEHTPLSFHLLYRPPHAHKCLAFEGTEPCQDFFVRNERYTDTTQHITSLSELDALLVDGGAESPSSSALSSVLKEEGAVFSQFLLMLPGEESFFHWKAVIEAMDPNGDILRVVRTTSPIRGDCIWLEVLPSHVGKSMAVEEVATRYDIRQADCFGFGNDFNDLDLLEWCGGGAGLVSNAPEALKHSILRAKRRTTSSDGSSGHEGTEVAAKEAAAEGEVEMVKPEHLGGLSNITLLTKKSSEGGVAEGLQLFFPSGST